MNSPGSVVSSVVGSCCGIPVAGSIGTPASASSAVFGAKPVITYTNRAASRSSPAGPRIVTHPGAIDVTQHPGLDPLVERRAEVHERHPRAGTPQIQHRLRRRVPAAHHDDVLIVRAVP